METLSQILRTLLYEIMNVISSIVYSTVQGVIFGLVLSIVILWQGRKRGWFRRPVALWNMLLRLRYLVLPLLLMMLCGSIGFVHGIQKNADMLIVKASSTFTEILGSEFVSGLTLSIRSQGVPQAMSVRQYISIYVEDAHKLRPGSMQHTFARLFYEEFARQVSAELGLGHGISSSVGALLQASRDADRLAHVKVSPPKLLQSTSDRFFRYLYLNTWFTFLPFLLIFLAEGAVYLYFYRKQDMRDRVQGISLTIRSMLARFQQDRTGTGS